MKQSSTEKPSIQLQFENDRKQQPRKQNKEVKHKGRYLKPYKLLLHTERPLH
jgi:hypothetical protein